MAYHVQCKLPAEAEWTTLGSSSKAAPDELARSWCANMMERYRRLNVLPEDTQFRIASDEQLPPATRTRLAPSGARCSKRKFTSFDVMRRSARWSRPRTRARCFNDGLMKSVDRSKEPKMPWSAPYGVRGACLIGIVAGVVCGAI